MLYNWNFRDVRGDWRYHCCSGGKVKLALGFATNDVYMNILALVRRRHQHGNETVERFRRILIRSHIRTYNR